MTGHLSLAELTRPAPAPEPEPEPKSRSRWTRGMTELMRCEINYEQAMYDLGWGTGMWRWRCESGLDQELWTMKMNLRSGGST